jgi:hypothetical protein
VERWPGAHGGASASGWGTLPPQCGPAGQRSKSESGNQEVLIFETPEQRELFEKTVAAIRQIPRHRGRTSRCWPSARAGSAGDRAARTDRGLDYRRYVFSEVRLQVGRRAPSVLRSFKQGLWHQEHRGWGKVLATNAISPGVDIAMKAGLKKHRVIDKRDYTVIETLFPRR